MGIIDTNINFQNWPVAFRRLIPNPMALVSMRWNTKGLIWAGLAWSGTCMHGLRRPKSMRSQLEVYTYMSIYSELWGAWLRESHLERFPISSTRAVHL